MNKHIIGAAAAALAPLLWLEPAAALDAYGRFDVGAGDVHLGPAQVSGDLIGGAIGFDELGPFRGEFGLDHFDAPLFGATATAWNARGTLFLDIPLGDRLTISPNVGVDWANVDVGFGSADGTGHHYGVEASTPITDTLDLVGGVSNTELDFDGFNVSVRAVRLGLRFDL